MESSLKCHQKHTLSTDIYQHRSQIELHIYHSLPISLKTKSPAKKIIRLANNLLKLNLFQCSLLCLLIKKTSPQPQIKLFQKLNLSSIQILNETYDRQVLLFLLLNAYHVKTNFAPNGAELDIDPILLDHVPSFRQIYSDWKPQKSVKNISITEINRFFQTWNQTKNSHVLKPKIDYNKIVDKILILSKTYNVAGTLDDANSVARQENHLKPNHNKKQEAGHKKRKPNESSQLKIRYCQEKDIPSENHQQNSPMKNSVSNKIPWFQDNNDIINLGRSQRTLNRSFYNLRSDDVAPNMFQSFRSQDSGMLDSLRNTSNGRYFNLNNSFANMNNQSIMGGGFGMFKSSLESDILHVHETGVKKSKKGQVSEPKLKPTVSFDEL